MKLSPTAIEPQRDRLCFCCGQDNRHGLRLRYHYPQAGTAATELAVPEHFSGWQGVTHGGLLAMVLDETMAHACISAGRNAVTADMSVRFRQPLPVGTRVQVVAQVARQRTRVLETTGTVVLADGTMVAEATGRYLGAGPSTGAGVGTDGGTPAASPG